MKTLKKFCIEDQNQHIIILIDINIIRFTPNKTCVTET